MNGPSFNSQEEEQESINLQAEFETQEETHKHTMTPEEINIAIAEACGKDPTGYYCPECRECVSVDEITNSGSHRGFCGGSIHSDNPDYYGDLNAMFEAEKVLSEGRSKNCDNTEMSKFMEELEKIVGSGVWELIHSTAAQRAESFLKCLNLWKE